MPLIDFEVLRRQVRIGDVLRMLGILKASRECSVIRIPCPLHCHEDPRGCSINWPRQQWFCHRCRQGGGSLELYQKVTKMDLYRACLELCRVLGIMVPFKHGARPAMHDQPYPPGFPLGNDTEGDVE